MESSATENKSNLALVIAIIALLKSLGSGVTQLITNQLAPTPPPDPQRLVAFGKVTTNGAGGVDNSTTFPTASFDATGSLLIITFPAGTVAAFTGVIVVNAKSGGVPLTANSDMASDDEIAIDCRDDTGAQVPANTNIITYMFHVAQ